MNRILIFLTLAVFAILNSNAQPRVNPIDNNYKQLRVSGLVQNPVGWYLINGKWCGYYGVINNEYKNNSKTPINLAVSTKSKINNNIISMQFKELKSNDSLYYALYIVKYDGWYDYPHICQDWHYYKTCDIHIFTKKEYQKLKDLKVGINTINSFRLTGPEKYTTYNSVQGQREIKVRLDNIFDDIKNDSSALYPNSYNKWYVKVEEDNKTVRFILPTYKILWEEAQQINKKKEKDRYYLPISHYDCVDFSTEYFELPKVQFDKLIIK